jgi:glutathione S-transferase
MSKLARLYTIPISHYGERARWALDMSDVAYEEHHHLQMFSWVVALGLGGRKFLPVLATGADTINDSAQIMRWAAGHGAALYPTDDALDRELADVYGVATRRVAYDWFFRALDTCLHYNHGRAPRAEVLAIRAGMPLASTFLKRYLNVSEAGVAQAREQIDRMLDRVAAMLADGRRYLTGDRFTAVDLTFAAMTAPAVMPQRYGVPMPELHEFPPDAAARVREARAHPAGAFAMRLYDERPRVRARYVRELVSDTLRARESARIAR